MVSFSIAKAQNNEIDSMSIDVVFEACAAMQESLEKNDTTALLEAASKLGNSKATSFTSLRCKDDTIHSMNGHFVFNDVFVDSLAAGNDAYSNADMGASLPRHVLSKLEKVLDTHSLLVANRNLALSQSLEANYMCVFMSPTDMDWMYVIMTTRMQ